MPPLIISPEKLTELWSRFREIFPDFVDFKSPQQKFVQEEVTYKREIVRRYREEVGNAQLRQWLEAGQGTKALKELSKRIQAPKSPLVSFYSWNASVGDKDQPCAVILKAFLDAAETPYAGPSTIQPIIQATLGQGLKPSWDTLSCLLWVMRPTDYFPVQITAWRELAEELGQPLPKQKRPTAEDFDAVMKFGQAFRNAFEPLQPADDDWIKVQSFIYVVSPAYKPDSIATQPAVDTISPTEEPGGGTVQAATNVVALNRILYGPPGTGKTYSTIEEAVKIIEPNSAGNHAAQKQRFDELLAKGRVEFITFHQSYSYEDFVEGIRPVLDADEENPIARYECRPGAFKRLACNALFACLEPDSTVQPIEETQFGGEVLPEQKKTEEEKAKIVQRFLTGGNKSGYHLKSASCPRYVLIIDEINRGNISKILGELITLIEDDKRLGAENSLVVTLPYSGDKFAIPGNLYVLGTMNTADKSIALVDLALRRRFEFEELHVRMDRCTGLTEDMHRVLSTLNHRITLRKDRDHQIGHAYFIGVKNIPGFNQTFRKKIIPLLQEYFYNDWDGLRYVLGEKDQDRFISKLDGSDAKEARTRWQWFFDRGVDIDCLKELCANYGIV